MLTSASRGGTWGIAAVIPKYLSLRLLNGEILIERQIRQLQEAGVMDITIVTGYKAAMFDYLRVKFGVDTVFYEDYNRYNNTSSIIRVIDRLNERFLYKLNSILHRNNVNFLKNAVF